MPKSPRGHYRYTSTLSLTSALNGVGGQRHVQLALPPVKSRYPSYGWVPGPVWLRVENLVPTGIVSPDRPSRSQSLYRLSYPGPLLTVRLQRKYHSSAAQNAPFRVQGSASNLQHFTLQLAPTSLGTGTQVH
jgi:hypothetical protein